MAIQQKPNFQIAWAETGNKVAVSEAKLRQGWVAEIPPAEVENFYQNKQDTAIQHIFQSGIPVWDSLTNYTANKSIVQGSNGFIYVANSDNTGQNPLVTTAWRLLIDNASQLVNQSRAINTGYGLQGGGNLTSDRSLSLAASGVAPGTYGSSGSVSRVTIDSAGRVTTAANQAIDFNSPFSDKLLASQGYQKLPGGLILQWGVLVGPIKIVTLGTFTIPFPTACLNIVASKGSDISPTAEYTIGIQPENTTGYRFLISGPNNGSQTFYWQAIGY